MWLRLLSCCLILLALTGCSIAGKEVKSVSPPEGMVYVPKGWFLMGSTEKDGRVGRSVGVAELPQHKVYAEAFFIDRYEVSEGEFRRFLEATGRMAPRIWTVEEYVAMYPEPIDDHPMKGVSWYDADEYCKWVEKRLPTEAEWEKAARGTDGRQFPWGNEPNLPSKLMANSQESGIWWTTPVVSFKQGASPYGVINMSGNVMEWTSSWYKPYPGSTLQREAFGEKFKILKGGAWGNPTVPLGRSAYRYAVAPQWDHPSHGFRCAKDAE